MKKKIDVEYLFKSSCYISRLDFLTINFNVVGGEQKFRFYDLETIYQNRFYPNMIGGDC